MVGVARLELAASWSRTMRATICATPRNSFIIITTQVRLVKQNFHTFFPIPEKGMFFCLSS